MKCEVKVRDVGGAYLATSGRGRLRRTASCTMGPELAAKRCAAKVFRLDPSNTQTEADISLTELGRGHYRAELPAQEIL